MLVLLGKTNPPSATDVVEALCDSIIRKDKTTQKELTSFSINDELVSSLSEIKEEHKEIGASYSPIIVKEYDSENASFTVVKIPIQKKLDIDFLCKMTSHQWSIVSISVNNE
ncbi:MAG: hypothetical protein U0R17_07445 [Acidimicrobiia bacterium]